MTEVNVGGQTLVRPDATQYSVSIAQGDSKLLRILAALNNNFSKNRVTVDRKDPVALTQEQCDALSSFVGYLTNAESMKALDEELDDKGRQKHSDRWDRDASVIDKIARIHHSSDSRSEYLTHEIVDKSILSRLGVVFTKAVTLGLATADLDRVMPIPRRLPFETAEPIYTEGTFRSWDLRVKMFRDIPSSLITEFAQALDDIVQTYCVCAFVKSERTNAIETAADGSGEVLPVLSSFRINVDSTGVIAKRFLRLTWALIDILVAQKGITDEQDSLLKLIARDYPRFRAELEAQKTGVFFTKIFVVSVLLYRAQRYTDFSVGI